MILDALSKVEVNGSRNFRSIFADLVEQSSFGNYIDCLSIQTDVMEKKQFMRVKEPFSDFIVAAKSSETMDIPTNYLEHDYDLTQGDKKSKRTKIDMSSCESYPIKMVALRVGWIINTQEGRDFLQAVLDTGNMEFFNI